MFHERISVWNKMIAKFRWHYIPVCTLVGHSWKLADNNTIDYQKTSGCIFLQQLIDIMSPPIQDLSRNLRTMMIPSSPMKMVTR